MDAANVFRLISLIPDRALRVQRGAVFVAQGKSDRVMLLSKFLHWLGPLDPVSKEDQQALGVRSGGGRALADEGEEPELEAAEEEAEAPPAAPATGTQLAA